MARPHTRRLFQRVLAEAGKLLSVVRGLEVYGIDQFWQSLYRPDLVKEKLAGDPERQGEGGRRQARP